MSSNIPEARMEIPLAEKINGGPFLDWDAQTTENVAYY